MLFFFTADFGVARVLDRASIAKSFCGEFMILFSAVTSRSSGTITNATSFGAVIFGLVSRAILGCYKLV